MVQGPAARVDARRGRSGATRCGALDWRGDPQNLPAGLTKPWPGRGLRERLGGGDYGSAYVERARSTTSCATRRSPASRSSRATATASGPDYAAKALPPRRSSRWASASSAARCRPGPGGGAGAQPSARTIRCARCSSRTGPAASGRRGGQHAAAPRRPLLPRICQRAAISSARARCRIPTLAPHLEFVDLGGHGYATVRAVGR